MPEITEVERIVQTLKSQIPKFKEIKPLLSSVNFVNLKQKQTTSKPCDYSQRELFDISRYGKYIFFEFKTLFSKQDAGCIVWHLGMSGLVRLTKDLSTLDIKAKNSLSTYFVIATPKGKYNVTFSGIRFSKYWYYPLASKSNFIKNKKLGADVILSNDQEIKQSLLDKLGSKRKIYSILMDQKILSGLGNWMVNEILYREEIHPNTRFNLISIHELDSIIKTIREVTQIGINAGGLSFDSYENIDGQKGDVQKTLMAYDREGYPCQKSSGRIKRIKVDNRSCYISEKIQKERTRKPEVMSL